MDVIVLLAIFIIVALAANRIGAVFGQYGLPKITGYLFTGLLAGPFVLDIIPQGGTRQLLFIDEVALAFIAFAAGSELYLPELKGRLRTIGLVTGGLVFFTFIFTGAVVFLMGDSIPFMNQMNGIERVAVALLMGSILVARSPSSAIAIVNELRAKGPFTQMALGVTVIMDVLVIVLFAISSSAADALLTNVALNLSFVLVLVTDLGLAALEGFVLYKILNWILGWNESSRVKTILLLLIGYTVFVLSEQLRHVSHDMLPFELLVEPLLVCLIASFLINNYSPHRLTMVRILHDTGPLIYVLFFTLTGASLELGLLLQTWPVALALFGTRLAAVVTGSFLGGAIAGDDFIKNRIKWMAFVTQAGVALGLAKEVAVEFPELGNGFATLVISVVVINESVGPLFFKRAIKIVGESHTRADTPEFDGVRDALIFGRDAQALILARQLLSHDWEVKLAWAGDPEDERTYVHNDFDIHHVERVGPEELKALDCHAADAVVLMLSNEENYALAELIYERVGTENMIALMDKRADATRLVELGARVVEPGTAIVSLLDHMVRAPSAASILMGLDEEQDIIDVELRDALLDGLALRQLRLPLDVVVLSIHRHGQLIVPHGHTRLRRGDRITVIGSNESLDEVTLRFDPVT